MKAYWSELGFSIENLDQLVHTWHEGSQPINMVISGMHSVTSQVIVVIWHGSSLHSYDLVPWEEHQYKIPSLSCIKLHSKGLRVCQWTEFGTVNNYRAGKFSVRTVLLEWLNLDQIAQWEYYVVSRVINWQPIQFRFIIREYPVVEE